MQVVIQKRNCREGLKRVKQEKVERQTKALLINLIIAVVVYGSILWEVL